MKVLCSTSQVPFITNPPQTNSYSHAWEVFWKNPCNGSGYTGRNVHCSPRNKRYRSPTTGRGGPRGSGYVKTLDLLDVQHYEGGKSSALCTGRLYHRRNPWYLFLQAESTPGHMVLSVATIKIPIDTTGNWSRSPRKGPLLIGWM
jgi:hypothetical protein